MPLVETLEGASKGGFQGIKKIKGLLLSISDEPIDPPESWTSYGNGPVKQLVEVKLEDATVLEMFNGEDEFQLKEGKFNFYVPYAEKGKIPNEKSIYMKCWVASATECGGKPSSFIGTYVTFEKQPRKLFDAPEIDPDTKKPKLGPDGKKLMKEVLAVDRSGQANHFCFVKEESSSDSGIKTYVRDALVGLNPQAALRKLITDQKIKAFPDFKKAYNEGTLASDLGLVMVDGLYQRPTE